MTSVEQRFSSPQARKEPVGSPITVWEYAEFSVYFEYNHVLHTVLKPSPWLFTLFSQAPASQMGTAMRGHADLAPRTNRLGRPVG